MCGKEKDCIHSIATRGFIGCDSTAAGKNTVICEFPDWEGKECPFTMLEKGEITEAQFYDLWLKAVQIYQQDSQ